MTKYEPLIGLEVHAQIHTYSKMFCGCPVVEDTGELEPNAYICPVCTGMPGVLPVVNRRAVELAIMTGLALHCEIPRCSRFARKSYFYPDLPKGYQISQYAPVFPPLTVDGYLDIETDAGPKRIRINRAHLEEDAGKLYHVDGATLVDLNRAGVPLLEIVSEPDVRSADEARAYCEALREIVVYLGINSGNMERGVIRFEANVSVRPVGSDELGPRHEIKNLNSFRALWDSIKYEIDHQTSVLSRGGTIESQTMGWNEADGMTVPQRGKEFAHDYRYFPEPDIPLVEVSRERVETLRQGIPELPRVKRKRFANSYGLTDYDAGVLVEKKAVADYYERVVSLGVAPKQAANWVTGELFRLMKERDETVERIQVSAEGLAELIRLVENGTINQSTGKGILEQMARTGRGPSAIVEEDGLSQISDQARMQAIVDQVLTQNPEQVEEYLEGKEQVIGWFIGRIMRATRGKANPQVARDVLDKALEARRGWQMEKQS